MIIFDFDGTLADTFSWFANNINKAAKKYKFLPVDLEEIKNLRQFSAGEMLKRHRVPTWKLPVIAAYMRKLMLAEIDELSLFAGIDEMLKKFKEKNIKLALVTSNSKKNVSQVLGEQNISCFDFFVCGVSIFGKKRKLKKVMKKSGVSKDKTIYIGDEIRDAEAAKALGIHFGAVSWGYNDEKALKNHSPDVVFQTLSEMSDFLI